MFSKVLVANRAEIAVRGFRAAYELGARTVAVFPYEDRNSEHRLKADEAYLIGEPGHPVRAYLSIDEIIRVARESGADAVYPGYGFLSENPDLARACADAGIAFIGPPADVLELAGNKVRALEAARAAGIPVLPSSAPSSDVDELVAAAEDVGFPLFVKAVAGGGGRGMRRVDEPERLPQALAAAMREADSAFGDPTVFLERAVLRPRHIEVQVLADATGEVVHLFERDCSVQRRRQKLIEEAPCPAMTPELRERMGQAAVRAAKAVGYVGAGTLEFLLGPDGRFYFMEMNTRIQVEHPVTEMITGVDLIREMIRVAEGHPLSFTQEDLKIDGWAIECRINAEDPERGFMPSPGTLKFYLPPGGIGVRVDSGAYPGLVITPHYDSMIAKLIVWAPTREEAIARMRRALAEFAIDGIKTTIPFHLRVLNHPVFERGDFDIKFLEEHDLFADEAGLS